MLNKEEMKNELSFLMLKLSLVETNIAYLKESLVELRDRMLDKDILKYRDEMKGERDGS